MQRFFIPGKKFDLLDHEDASFDLHYNLIFSELMARRRTVQFVESANKIAYKSAHEYHMQKSLLFKPVLAIGVESKELFTDGELDALYEKTEDRQEVCRVPLRVVADGRKAYVRRMD